MGCQCSNFDNNEEIKTSVVEPLADVIKGQFQEYDVLVYSKSNCEASVKVKQILRVNKIQFEYFEADNMSEGSQFMSVLQKLTNRKNTPYVFVMGKFYGGIREVQNGINSGDLIKKIKKT